MTKSKRTQGELLEEISYKLTVIIDQLGNILDYKSPVEDDNIEEQYPEQIDNNRGDYSSLFGVIREGCSNYRLANNGLFLYTN